MQQVFWCNMHLCLSKHFLVIIMMNVPTLIYNSCTSLQMDKNCSGQRPLVWCYQQSLHDLTSQTLSSRRHHTLVFVSSPNHQTLVQTIRLKHNHWTLAWPPDFGILPLCSWQLILDGQTKGGTDWSLQGRGAKQSPNNWNQDP